jgi:hypothetical protein
MSLKSQLTTIGSVSRRGFLSRTAVGVLGAATVPAIATSITADGDAKSTAFSAAGKQFTFDTGKLSGVLQQTGSPSGIHPITENASGAPLSRALGLMSFYRLLATDQRYLPDARGWPNEAELRGDGSVVCQWTADDDHPFDMTATYRWTESDVLDVVTTVAAEKDLARFEVFRTCYFNGFGRSWAYASVDGKLRFVEAAKSDGHWQMFPRDEEAIKLICDGRWSKPPHPVDWVIRPQLAVPVGMRRDKATGLVALLMAPSDDCFAVSTPYGEEGHRSLYLSLGGKDIAAGEKATYRSRLVLRKDLSDEEAIGLYEKYTKPDS